MNTREAMRHLEYLGIEPGCAILRPRASLGQARVAITGSIILMAFIVVSLVCFTVGSAAGTAGVAAPMTHSVSEDVTFSASPVAPAPSFVPPQFVGRELTHMDREWLKFGFLSVQFMNAVFAGLHAQ